MHSGTTAEHSDRGRQKGTPMNRLYTRTLTLLTIVLAALASAGDQPLFSRHRDERGSLSTEQVVVTGVLLLLAIGVAGAIKLAVDGRIDAIK